MTESQAKPKARRLLRTSRARKTAKAEPTGDAPSHLIDQRIRDLGGWRGDTLARMRKLILEADPEMIEEWKWNNPVWSHNGIVCTGEAYKNVVKLTFARGAGVSDPARLFNSSLQGSTRRAIDIHEGEEIDAKAFQALIQAAAARNRGDVSVVVSLRETSHHAKRDDHVKDSQAKTANPVKLLSGGNPQIAKAYGDSPVLAYIEAMPGWKSDVGRRLDALISRTVPGVSKAVKWNSPLYGVEGQGWFLGIHCFTKYIKLAFFRGKSLRPLPPGKSKQKEVRYLDIYEDDKIDEARLARWVKQASQLPGEKM